MVGSMTALRLAEMSSHVPRCSQERRPKSVANRTSSPRLMGQSNSSGTLVRPIISRCMSTQMASGDRVRSVAERTSAAFWPRASHRSGPCSVREGTVSDAIAPHEHVVRFFHRHCVSRGRLRGSVVRRTPYTEPKSVFVVERAPGGTATELLATKPSHGWIRWRVDALRSKPLNSEPRFDVKWNPEGAVGPFANFRDSHALLVGPVSDAAAVEELVALAVHENAGLFVDPSDHD